MAREGSRKALAAATVTEGRKNILNYILIIQCAESSMLLREPTQQDYNQIHNLVKNELGLDCFYVK